MPCNNTEEMDGNQSLSGESLWGSHISVLVAGKSSVARGSAGPQYHWGGLRTRQGVCCSSGRLDEEGSGKQRAGEAGPEGKVALHRRRGSRGTHPAMGLQGSLSGLLLGWDVLSLPCSPQNLQQFSISLSIITQVDPSGGTLMKMVVVVMVVMMITANIGDAY